MHAVVVTAAIEDFEKARQALADDVIPKVKNAAGFVAGYWLEPVDDQGLSIVVFETEEDAREMSKMVEPGATPSPFATIRTMEVREVVGHG